MDIRLSRLLAMLETAKDEEEIAEVVLQFANACELEWLTYLSFSFPENNAVSGHHPERHRRSANSKHIEGDSASRVAIRPRQAFTWTTDLGVEISRLRPETREFGIRSSIFVPVKLGLKGLVLLTFTGSSQKETTDPADGRSGASETGAYLHMKLAHRANPPPSAAVNTLSPRQSECLDWSSRGKTAPEIALILGISESAVTFHLKELRKKLNADTIAHAVAEGFRRNLL